MFCCSLLWIYKLSASENPLFLPPLSWDNHTSAAETGENASIPEEIPIAPVLGSDWDMFLRRRDIPLPPLASSLQPWPSNQPNISYFPCEPLVEKPDLAASSNVSCVLSKFGYTKAQADETYNPNKHHRRCADLPSSFISLQNK
jgi:hypothetical protein